MRIDEGWDTGDILLQRPCAIDALDDAGALEARLSQLGQETLLDALTRLREGQIEAVAQEEGAGTYARKLSKEEAAIDWSRDAAAICRAIRAYAPSPVAHTWLGSMRIRVWDARTLQDDDTHRNTAAPGEIIAVQREGIDVACGPGTVRLTRLQIPVGQGKVLPVADILNARQDLFVVGDTLTPAVGES